MKLGIALPTIIVNSWGGGARKPNNQTKIALTKP